MNFGRKRLSGVDRSEIRELSEIILDTEKRDTDLPKPVLDDKRGVVIESGEPIEIPPQNMDQNISELIEDAKFSGPGYAKKDPLFRGLPKTDRNINKRYWEAKDQSDSENLDLSENKGVGVNPSLRPSNLTTRGVNLPEADVSVVSPTENTDNNSGSLDSSNQDLPESEVIDTESRTINKDSRENKKSLEPLDYSNQPEVMRDEYGNIIGYHNPTVRTIGSYEKRSRPKSAQLDKTEDKEDDFEKTPLAKPENESDFIPGPVEENLLDLDSLVGISRNFKEIYDVLGGQEVIVGSEEEFPVGRVRSLIEDVRQGKRDINAVTRTNGLREKVAEFLVDTGRFTEVRQVDSFANLYNLIQKFDVIVGSSEVFSADKLKMIIEKVRQGDLGIEYVTRTYGLRDKVQELINKEIPEIILNEKGNSLLGEEVGQTVRSSFEEAKQSDESSSRWPKLKQYTHLLKLGVGRIGERWFGKKENKEEPTVWGEKADIQAEKIKLEINELKEELYTLSGRKMNENELLDEYLYHQQKVFEYKLSKAERVEDGVVDNAIIYLKRYFENYSEKYSASFVRATLERFQGELREKLNKHNGELLKRDRKALAEFAKQVLSGDSPRAEDVVRDVLEKNK